MEAGNGLRRLIKSLEDRRQKIFEQVQKSRTDLGLARGANKIWEKRLKWIDDQIAQAKQGQLNLGLEEVPPPDADDPDGFFELLGRPGED